jgi:acyl-CoA reductase-like NAD-dependent aldehyde dehydrogenase
LYNKEYEVNSPHTSLTRAWEFGHHGSFDGKINIGILAAGTLKRISLELGGNAPFIVFDDADVDLAVEGGPRFLFGHRGGWHYSIVRFCITKSMK